MELQICTLIDVPQLHVQFVMAVNYRYVSYRMEFNLMKVNLINECLQHMALRDGWRVASYFFGRGCMSTCLVACFFLVFRKTTVQMNRVN